MKPDVVCLWEVQKADWPEYAEWTGDAVTYTEYVARLSAARHVADETGCEVIVWSGRLAVLRQTMQDMGLRNTPDNRAQAIAMCGAQTLRRDSQGRPTLAPEPTGSLIHDPIRSALYMAILRGYSQADIAAGCGVSQVSTSRYLRGDRYLKEPSLSRLVAWLRKNGFMEE